MANTPKSQGRFGTFGGVFTPCTLTILGVIMFLRFGQVVGQSGLIRGLAIVLAAKVITTLTALSLSSVATNTCIRGGGAYFLISRSLGVEFGSAIGILFFFAQAISVAMYVIGFTEAFFSAFPSISQSVRLVATATNLAVFVCVFVGAGWTIKVQYAILALLLLSLGSFAAGAFRSFSFDHLTANLTPSFSEGQGVVAMFALFFPAATGIMAGANMSGDLRDPGRAIPRGTLAAIDFMLVIYLHMASLFCATRSQGELVGDNLIIKEDWSVTQVDHSRHLRGDTIVSARKHDGRASYPTGFRRGLCYSDFDPFCQG